MYLAVSTRPDIAHAVNAVSRINTRPTYASCKAVLYILRYVSDTRGEGIVFPNTTHSQPLVAYSDADWAGDLDTGRSTTGYIVYLWGAPIAWQSRLQPTVATSQWKLSTWLPLPLFRILCGYEGQRQSSV